MNRTSFGRVSTKTPSPDPERSDASPTGAPGSVRIQRDGAIGWLIFDHEARRNAMTIDMWRAVPECCAELASDPDIRVVVLRGAGEHAFVAGADISQFETERTGTGGSYEAATSGAYAAIEELPKPTLAMLHGFCIGGGLAIALSADIRYGEPGTRMALPPAKLGIGYSPDGLQTLVDLVGPSVTKELVYTGDLHDAETCLRWGLLNHVVDKSELEAFVVAQASTMASRAPLTQLAAKQAIAHSPSAPATIARCMSSADYAEGVAAFLEKRPPVFTGN